MDKFNVVIRDDETNSVAEYEVYARFQKGAMKKAVQMFEDDFPESNKCDVVTITAERV